MPNPPPPQVPNFTPGVGRLATDRYDFESHIQGTNFRHQANQTDLFPTLVLNSQTLTNVQDAISALIAASAPPVITQATIGNATNNLGVVTLGGDLGALSGAGAGASTALKPKVTGIQGFPISPVTPNPNNVLTWGGSSWVPSPAQGVFTPAGDLAGSTSTQQVIGLTGNTTTNPGFHTVVASTDYIGFINTATPILTQIITSSGSGHNFSISAQSSSSLFGGNGGNVVLAGGNSFTGLTGGVALKMGDTNNMLQAIQVVNGQDVVALFTGAAGLTSTNAPLNSGTNVMFMGDTSSTITASPVGGTILYSKSGQLNIQQSNGVGFTVGTDPNPSVWPSVAPGSLPAVSFPTNGSITYNTVSTSVSTTPAVALTTVAMPDNTSIKLNMTFIGKAVGTADVAQFDSTVGFFRSSGGPPTTVGSGIFTIIDSRFTGSGASWSAPAASNSGNTIVVRTGSFSGININWTVIVKIIAVTA